MRKFVLSSVLLPLVFAAPALAVPPTTEVTVVELGDFAAENTELCGFTIFFDESGSFKVKTFYDAQGNPIRTILTNFKDRYTATATANGKTLSTNYPLAVIEYGEDLRVEMGLRNAYRVPGAGVVLLDAGAWSLISQPTTSFSKLANTSSWKATLTPSAATSPAPRPSPSSTTEETKPPHAARCSFAWNAAAGDLEVHEALLAREEAAVVGRVGK